MLRASFQQCIIQKSKASCSCEGRPQQPPLLIECAKRAPVHLQGRLNNGLQTCSCSSSSLRASAAGAKEAACECRAGADVTDPSDERALTRLSGPSGGAATPSCLSIAAAFLMLPHSFRNSTASCRVMQHEPENDDDLSRTMHHQTQNTPEGAA